jgi:hypothetical protein
LNRLWIDGAGGVPGSWGQHCRRKAKENRLEGLLNYIWALFRRDCTLWKSRLWGAMVLEKVMVWN